MAEAVKYLKKVVKIARNNFQNLDFVRASTMLGDIYNEKVSILCFYQVGEGGGGVIRMGNTCKSMADSCQCMIKTTKKKGKICRILNFCVHFILIFP